MYKKLFKFMLVVVIGLTVNACSNDFELTAPWSDIPIVYATLDAQANVNYIRVEKAFLDPETSAIELAKIPDSIYYDNNVQVALTRLKTNQTYTLERVNAATEGITREPGVFPTDPNILYKLTLSDSDLLQGGETVRLEINRGDNKEVVTAETTIVEPITLISGQPNDPIKFQWNLPERFGWRDSNGAGLYDLNLHIFYDEYEFGNPSEVTNQKLSWKIGENIKNSEGLARVREEITGEDFFKFLAANIPIETNKARIFQYMEMEVIAGGEELLTFTNINLANSGITGSQETPTYTNLSEGLGIFTSKTSVIKTAIDIHPETRDSLIENSYTRPLNFQ